MLDELVVRNLGVIKEAAIYPGPGLTVVTGETGAGKTLLVGALRLLLGADGGADLVGPFGEEGSAEGRFLIAGREIAAVRRLFRQGRSRAYLDGSIASNKALTDELSESIDIIGQQDHLSLTRAAVVRNLVDANLDSKGRGFLDEYGRMRGHWQELIADQDRLGGDRRALARELDLVQFQADEIARAAFVPGEDQELELRANRLRHAEALSIHLGQARSAVGAGQERLGGAVAELRRAGRLDTGLAALAEGAEIEAEALAELARQVRLASEQIRPDPEQLETVEARLTLLGELRRKYGANLEEVLGFGKAAAERSAEITGLLARAETLDAEIASTQRELVEVAQRLTVARRSAGKRLTRAATGHLVDLGFSDPVIRVEVTESDLGPWGGDEVRLLFASDSRLSPGEVARVASGGELSRLVLSLRLASPHKEGASVLVFDEIDSGIGGATALAMGAKLAALAKERQVLCVTHLPQVAAFAGTHFIIEREGAAASVREVAGSDRTAELSRMLAGLPDSERGREAAGELLELAGS